MDSFITTTSPLSGAGLICTGICAVWAAAAGGWLATAAWRYRTRRTRFLASAGNAGFDPAESGCLWWLSRFAAGSDRTALLFSIEAFEESVRKAESVASDRVAWPAELTDSRIDALRRKIGGARRPLWNIASTRQIEVNQPLRLRTGGGEMDSFVVESGAQFFRVTLPVSPARAVSVVDGDEIEVNFCRAQDARYSCRTRAAGLGSDCTLRLDHTELTRIQQREVVRVRCRDEIRVALVTRGAALVHERLRGMPEGAFTARLRDLGAAGASFFSHRVRDVDSWVVVRFRLNHAPGAIIVPGRVIRVTQLSGTSESPMMVSVKFDPLTSQVEHHLSRLVADVQQRLIQRMLTRAGDQGNPLRPSLDESQLRTPAVNTPVLPLPDFSVVARGDERREGAA